MSTSPYPHIDNNKYSSTGACDCSSCVSERSKQSISSGIITTGSSSNDISSVPDWSDISSKHQHSERHKRRETHREHRRHHEPHNRDYRCCDQANCSDNNGCYDPGTSTFISIITPVTGLTPLYSGVTGSVEFRMRRKNKVVNLQWEPFTGSMAASSVAFLTVAQSISNTPPYPISQPIYIQYRGADRPVKIVIDPNARGSNVHIYLNTDSSTTNINMGDSFQVYGGNITWSVD
jgi:hypothetical protein